MLLRFEVAHTLYAQPPTYGRLTHDADFVFVFIYAFVVNDLAWALVFRPPEAWGIDHVAGLRVSDRLRRSGSWIGFWFWFWFWFWLWLWLWLWCRLHFGDCRHLLWYRFLFWDGLMERFGLRDLKLFFLNQ